MKTIKRLPESELEIMQIIWEEEPPVSRMTVERELRKEHPLAPTTILTLLTRLAFGMDYPFASMPVQGIRNMDRRDIAFAREFGYRIKLIAEARLHRDEGTGKTRLEAGVFPALVHHSFLLARVGGVYNAVRIESQVSGPIFLHGRGAGALPTASVVLSDLMAVAREDKPNNTGFVTEIERADIVPPEDWRSRYYVRVMVSDESGVLRDVAGCMAAEDISMAQVIQKENEKNVVPLVYMTHETTAQAMARAMQKLKETGILRAEPVFYRIL